MTTEKKTYYVAVLEKNRIEEKKMIWGIGLSEDEAYNDCFQNIKENGYFLPVYPCSKALYDFAYKHGGNEAMKNAFMHVDEDFMDLYPSRDALYDFCEKYNITGEAKDELQALLDFSINYAYDVRRGREDE